MAFMTFDYSNSSLSCFHDADRVRLSMLSSLSPVSRRLVRASRRVVRARCLKNESFPVFRCASDYDDDGG